jgi:hypothetical protein
VPGITGSTFSDSRVLLELSARIWLDDVPVALASERVTAELCRRATIQLASASMASADLAIDRDPAIVG